MSEVLKKVINVAGYDASGASGKRLHVVSAALELIAARVSSGVAVHLDDEISRLSSYADQIQAAIDKK